MPKVLQLPFCYYPDPIGGTEVHVASMSKYIATRGWQSVIVAPGAEETSYEHDGLRVRRYVVGPISDPSDIHGPGDLASAAAFGRICDEERPDLVHLHSWTRGVSLRVVREAKRRGIRVLFSFHVAAVSCPRGSMMRWGEEACDGVLDLDRCAPCTLHGRGMRRSAAEAVGRVPARLGEALGSIGLSGGVFTALRMRELLRLRNETFLSLMREVDGVIVVAEWVRQVLLRNGVPPEKISLSRYGLAQAVGTLTFDSALRPADELPVRVVFLGRIDPIKGPDTIIRAVRALPDAPIALDLIGVVQGSNGEKYLAELKTLAAADPRIRFLPPISNQAAPETVRGYHVMAVPSRVQDVSPFVVMESLAAGVPVIGANTGGIPEAIRDGENGLLARGDSVPEWTRALRRLVEEKGLIAKLRSGIRAPRGVGEASEEVLAVYEPLIRQRGSKSAT